MKKQIKVDDLVNILMAIEKDTPAEIITVTEPAMRKKNNPYIGEVTKRVVSNVLLNYDYSKEVNRQRAREGKEFDFEPKKRAWGTRMGDTGLISHNAMIYVDCRFLCVKDDKLFHNGKEIEKTLLLEYLQERNSSAEKQGLSTEDEVIVRTYKLKSIINISIKTGAKAGDYEIVA